MTENEKAILWEARATVCQNMLRLVAGSANHKDARAFAKAAMDECSQSNADDISVMGAIERSKTIRG